MTNQKIKPSEKVLTPGELEIMRVLWKRDGATAREVVEEIKLKRDSKYTTIQTLLTIMAKKNYVRVERDGKAHRFIPLLSKTQAQTKAIKQLISQFFDHSSSALAQHVVDSDTLQLSELEQLKNLIEEKTNGEINDEPMDK